MAPWDRGKEQQQEQETGHSEDNKCKANIPIFRGCNQRHSMDVANTEYGPIFDLHGKFFPFVKLYKYVSVKTKQCRGRLTSHLSRTYNDHGQKCLHSPTSIEAGATRITLAITRFDICGRMIIKATAFLGMAIIHSVQV